MTERTIEVAREALEELYRYIQTMPINDMEAFWESKSALRKLNNFVGLAEREMKGRK